jgi:hypothetical protein
MHLAFNCSLARSDVMTRRRGRAPKRQDSFGISEDLRCQAVALRRKFASAAFVIDHTAQGCAMTGCTKETVLKAVENKRFNCGSWGLERVKDDAMFQG